MRLAAPRRIYGAGAGDGSGARAADGDGQLDRPEGVTVRGDHVWVSDTYNNRILLFKR